MLVYRVVFLGTNYNIITFKFYFCLFIYYYYLFFVCVRNILHILKHMWLDRPVRSKVGARDQGANTRRNSSFDESIFSKKMSFACVR